MIELNGWDILTDTIGLLLIMFSTWTDHVWPEHKIRNFIIRAILGAVALTLIELF